MSPPGFLARVGRPWQISAHRFGSGVAARPSYAFRKSAWNLNRGTELKLTPLDHRTLISFDIDGTLEVGEPPGPLRLDFARWVQERGCIIGSSSDRTLSFQTGLWIRAGIAPEFVSGKHELTDVRTRFDSDRFIHIGDTQADEHFAAIAGFTYFPVEDLAARLRDCSQTGRELA